MVCWFMLVGARILVTITALSVHQVACGTLWMTIRYLRNVNALSHWHVDLFPFKTPPPNHARVKMELLIDHQMLT